MKFTCLAYHRISAEPAARADPYTVTPACLEAQLAWLAWRGYRGISVNQALATRAGDRQIALTFDDGYRDFYTDAWPIMRRYGFCCTLFLIAGRIGQNADWPEAQGAPLLAWPEVRELAAQGVEIAVHGISHQSLVGLETAVLQAELEAACQMISEKVGISPVGLAYPYGRYSSSITQAARMAGFAWAATARGGKNSPSTTPFALRRTLVEGRDADGWLFALKVRTGYAKMVEWRMDLRRVK